MCYGKVALRSTGMTRGKGSNQDKNHHQSEKRTISALTDTWKLREIPDMINIKKKWVWQNMVISQMCLLGEQGSSTGIWCTVWWLDRQKSCMIRDEYYLAWYLIQICMGLWMQFCHINAAYTKKRGKRKKNPRMFVLENGKHFYFAFCLKVFP